ncbi:MAG: hypothetical protein WC637_06795 [Victivallales bacterium]|jgi:hypothetical protein
MSESFLKNKNFAFVLACFVLAAAALQIVIGVFFRPLWFDEALTVMDFVMLPNIADIYWQYNIPNNHIVYNIFLRFWLELCGPAPYAISLRLFSVLTAFASIVLIMKLWKRRFCRETAVIACFCFAVSLPFAIYATAIRGYMLSFLLIIISLETALCYRDSRKTAHLLFFFILSFLAAGITPTNLIAFAAIYLLVLPSLKPKEILSDKTLYLGIIPVAAFFIFYIPIFGKLMKALSLSEGWSGGISASMHFYSAFLVSFLPLVILALIGIFASKEKSAAAERVQITLIFLIPLVIFLLKSPAPFPRAFFCLWPIWIFILCSLADPFIKHLNGKIPGVSLIAILCLCCAWSLWPYSFPVQFSENLTKGGQDDFFKPYFMRPEFNPIGTVRKSIELAGARSGVSAFVDFAADYPSIIFYGRLLNVDDSFWVFDKPNRKVASLGDIGSIYVITRSQGGMESIAKRFDIKSYELSADCGFQKIYLAKLK